MINVKKAVDLTMFLTNDLITAFGLNSYCDILLFSEFSSLICNNWDEVHDQVHFHCDLRYLGTFHFKLMSKDSHKKYDSQE